MDFSLLNEALASKSYERVADFCDELMLQAAAEGIIFQNEWPYSIHLLGHLYINDVNSARFLWKSIPLPIKENQPEIVAVWKLGQRLWTRDYAGVHEAIRGFNWSADVLSFVVAFSEMYTKKMFDLLLSAYSTISVTDTALFLGMSEEDATNCMSSCLYSGGPKGGQTFRLRRVFHSNTLLWRKTLLARQWILLPTADALQHGWTVDPASQMLTVKKLPVVRKQKLDPSKLQQLTEYVFQLEH